VRASQIFGGLAACALLLAACGDDSSSSGGEQVSSEKDPLEAFQAASEKTAESDETFRMSMAMEVGETDDECMASFWGQIDIGLDVEVEHLAEPVAVRATDTTTSLTAITVDGSLYVPAELFGDAVDSPTPWIRIDRGDREAVTALDDASIGLSTFQPTDPSLADQSEPDSLETLLDELRDTADSVTQVDREEVRGQPATHLRIEGTSVMSGSDSEDEGDTVEITPEGPETVDAWVGDDGYVLRLAITSPGIAPDDEDSIGFPSISVTFETWDHGADITVEAPPADEVTPASELDFSGAGPEDELDGLSPECLAELFGDLPIDEGPSVDVPEGFSYHLPEATDGFRACLTGAGIAFEEAPEDVGGIFIAVPSPDDAEYDAYLDCLIDLETPTTTSECQTEPTETDAGSLELDLTGCVDAPLCDDLPPEDQDMLCIEPLSPDQTFPASPPD
jgi:hypothetical protein